MDDRKRRTVNKHDPKKFFSSLRLKITANLKSAQLECIYTPTIWSDFLQFNLYTKESLAIISWIQKIWWVRASKSKYYPPFNTRNVRIHENLSCTFVYWLLGFYLDHDALPWQHVSHQDNIKLFCLISIASDTFGEIEWESLQYNINVTSCFRKGSIA